VVFTYIKLFLVFFFHNFFIWVRCCVVCRLVQDFFISRLVAVFDWFIFKDRLESIKNSIKDLSVNIAGKVTSYSSIHAHFFLSLLFSPLEFLFFFSFSTPPFSFFLHHLIDSLPLLHPHYSLWLSEPTESTFLLLDKSIKCGF